MRSEWLIALVVGVVIGWLLKPTETVHTHSEHRDTVVQVQPREVVRLVRVPADTVIVTEHDTVAMLDTIINHDTITVDYSYAHQAFSLLYRPRPDSVVTVYVTQVKTTERAWWIDALTHTGAAALGYTIGSAR